MESGTRTFYLGRYNCIEQLGTGPLGETYRAKIYGVAGFEKQFAVKRLQPGLSADEAFVARFVQAASAFAALEHQRIVRVHEVNAQGAHYYIVADLVRGLDVRRLLDLLQQRGEALPADLAMTIACDVADTLDYAHGRTNVQPGGVLHLGLTPASVMLTYEGEVKLIDFALLSALVRPGWSERDTLTPTLGYLSPEELRGDPLDGRADVFSLGVILHELLGGTRVFFSDRAAELRKAIESGPPPPPPADPRLQQIVTRALQPDREQRFASAGEMRMAIQAILGGRIERARSDLSALVRRLAMPRERRTGAFAAVSATVATGASTPVAARSAATPAVPRPWAPPVPKPPVGPQLSPIPQHNTLAGIGPDDQALVPIELIELPGLPTEKAMAAVNDEAETHRVERVTAETGGRPAATPPPPPPEALAPRGEPANGVGATASSNGAVPRAAAATTDARAEAAGVAPETGVAAEATGVAATSTATTDAATTSGAAPANAGGATNGAALSGKVPEPTWTPPPLAPSVPSPPPARFAEPSEPAPPPVEPARQAVPGASLPRRSGGSRAVFGTVTLLALAGVLAVYFGLSGHVGTKAETNAAPAPATLPAHAAQPTPATTAPAPANTTAVPAATTPKPAATTPGPATSTAPATASTTGTATAPATGATAKPAVAPTSAAPAPAATATATGGFEVTTTPPGATVFVDGEPSGTTPAQLAVAPGQHRLVIEGEHQLLVKRDVDVTPNGKLDVTLEPAKLPRDIAGPAGLKVRCHTKGELRIFVDGADSGLSCPNDERIDVTAGPHKIGLYSPRTNQMHEVEHEVTEGDYSTRVYVKY